MKKGENNQTLRDFLRTQTSRLHDQTEAVWMPGQRFACRSAYLHFLSVLLETHQDLGLPAAHRRGDADHIAAETDRLDALCSDLGCTRRQAATHAPMSQGYAWGVGYVLNGSAIGAATMLQKGWVGQDWPSHYMQQGLGYAQSGQLRAFFDQINSLDLNRSEVLLGARETFSTFYHPSPGKLYLREAS